VGFVFNPFTGNLDKVNPPPVYPVTSVSASDTTLTISPTTGAVLAAVNQAAAFNWTNAHTWGGVITIDASSSIQLNINSNMWVDDGGVVWTNSVTSTLGSGILQLDALLTRLADDNGLELDGGVLGFKQYGVRYFYFDGVTAAWDLPVTGLDDPYSASWDNNLEFPTKNAIYDKIETLSGGGGNSVTTTLAFGASFTDKAQTVVTGQAWVTSTSEISVTVKTPSGVDPDEMRLLDFKPVVSDLVAGTGFTVTLYSEPEAKGDYDIMCIGI